MRNSFYETKQPRKETSLDNGLTSSAPSCLENALLHFDSVGPLQAKKYHIVRRRHFGETTQILSTKVYWCFESMSINMNDTQFRFVCARYGWFFFCFVIDVYICDSIVRIPKLIWYLFININSQVYKCKGINPPLLAPTTA